MATTYQPKALTPSELSALSQAVKNALTELYGERLDRVILYGSYARGDFHAESDVDYLVVLKDDVVRGGQEIRQMAPVIGPLALVYGKEISLFPVASFGQSLFHQAIQQEGVTV